MKKLSNTEVELKNRIDYKKKCLVVYSEISQTYQMESFAEIANDF